MIQAEDVAQAVLYVLTSPPRCCPVEITIRPQRTPYR
jgi:NADP-dependent 3-hydroxy acid dehydrogenase YdfG